MDTFDKVIQLISSIEGDLGKALTPIDELTLKNKKELVEKVL